MSAIDDIAKLLEANDVPGDLRSHREFVQAQCDRMSTSALNRGYSENTALAVLGYVLNHHYFDIESHEKAQILIEAVFEMVCPLAGDDERK